MAAAGGEVEGFNYEEVEWTYQTGGSTGDVRRYGGGASDRLIAGFKPVLGWSWGETNSGSS